MLDWRVHRVAHPSLPSTSALRSDNLKSSGPRILLTYSTHSLHKHPRYLPLCPRETLVRHDLVEELRRRSTPGHIGELISGHLVPSSKNADVRESPCVLEQASRYAIDGEVREFLLSEGGGELRLKSVHLQYLALIGGEGREDLRERSTRHSFDAVVIEDVVLRQTSE